MWNEGQPALLASKFGHGEYQWIGRWSCHMVSSFVLVKISLCRWMATQGKKMRIGSDRREKGENVKWNLKTSTTRMCCRVIGSVAISCFQVLWPFILFVSSFFSPAKYWIADIQNVRIRMCRGDNRPSRELYSKRYANFMQIICWMAPKGNCLDRWGSDEGWGGGEFWTEIIQSQRHLASCCRRRGIKVDDHQLGMQLSWGAGHPAGNRRQLAAAAGRLHEKPFDDELCLITRAALRCRGHLTCYFIKDLWRAFDTRPVVSVTFSCDRPAGSDTTLTSDMLSCLHRGGMRTQKVGKTRPQGHSATTEKRQEENSSLDGFLHCHIEMRQYKAMGRSQSRQVKSSGEGQMAAKKERLAPCKSWRHLPLCYIISSGSLLTQVRVHYQPLTYNNFQFVQNINPKCSVTKDDLSRFRLAVTSLPSARVTLIDGKGAWLSLITPTVSVCQLHVVLGVQLLLAGEHTHLLDALYVNGGNWMEIWNTITDLSRVMSALCGGPAFL